MVVSGITHLCQIQLLSREVSSDTPVFPLILDEMQEYLSTEQWHRYIALSRSARGPMVLFTQGMESIGSLFKGEDGRHRVETLTGNLATTFVCSPTYETTRWLSERLGQERQFFFGGSTQTDAYANPLDLFTGGASSTSGSFNEQLQPRMRPDEIKLCLPPGGPPHWTVKTMIVIGSKFWFIDFPQEH
jgi:hypothetical protein